MTTTFVATVICTILGSGGLFTLVQFLINRHDTKDEELAQIKKELESLKRMLEKAEKDSCRSQMLILMSDYPNEKAELMTLAEHYFVNCNGNFYMDAIFRTWLDTNGIKTPSWFKRNGE